MKRLKFNLQSWVLYAVICYIILLPLKMYVIGISISLIIGFLFGILNDIVIQLRKLNGEKFPNMEEDEKEKPLE